MLNSKIQKLINQWLNHSNVSETLKSQIQNMTNDELASAFADKNLSFGTAGIRSITGPGTQRLNIHVYRQIAYAYAHFIKATSKNQFPSVIIVHDNRKDGDLFALACAEVLNFFKIKTWLAPQNILLATPIISYYIRKLNCDGGINITASHNPKAYNGFKAYNNTGSQVIPSEAKIILDNLLPSTEILDIAFDSSHALISYLPNDYLQVYFDEIIKAVELFKQNNTATSVLFSSHHGVGSQTTAKLAHQLGYINFQEYANECNITCDYSDSEITNPEDPRSFLPLEKFAKNTDIKYLMAQDPDGDRFALAELQKDGTWYYFNGNENGILFAHFLLTFNPEQVKQYVVSSYVSNNFIDRLVAPSVEVIRCGTGFKWICAEVEKMQSKGHNLLIAFEEAIGALMFPFNREKDGYQAVALSLIMISYYQAKNLLLTDVLKQLYQKHGHWYGTTDSFVFAGDDWQNKIKQKMDLLKNFKNSKIDKHIIHKIAWNEINECLDFILDEDNWIRFRGSGTEPKFKIYYNFYNKSQPLVLEDVAKVRAFLIEYLKL